MIPLNTLIPGILKNIKEYYLWVNRDFNIVWKILICIIVLLFIIEGVKKSRHGKIPAFLITLATIIVMLVMCNGVYLLMDGPPFTARTMSAFGLFLGILSITVVSNRRKLYKLCVIALCYCFVVFAFYFGNVLADQKRNDTFRMTMLLHDLTLLFPGSEIMEMKIQFDGGTGLTPMLGPLIRNYPLLSRERLVPSINFIWIPSTLSDHYQWGIYANANINLESFLQGSDFPFVPFDDFNNHNLPVVLDSYYHTIKSDGKEILVIFKSLGRF
jgi:hypothetical protein